MKLIVKILYLLTAVVIALWVVPNYLEYTKNRDIYHIKMKSLEDLDRREIPSDAKSFHTELFKEEMRGYFSEVKNINVNVVSIPNSKYEVRVLFPKKYLDNFLRILRDTPLNFNIYLNDEIVYKQSNRIVEAKFIVTPY
ncbi:MAG: hypothetical protein GXO06_00890 [Epsilonproteobacteria bacterium]|nr:hypothetical protein [Campylobacterota bacterium]